jgi:antitoxin (DNA-binding transcriptional repressor) of toxin-antitoxin stability system
MTTFKLNEAPEIFEALIDRVLAGEQIVIERDGEFVELVEIVAQLHQSRDHD